MTKYLISGAAVAALLVSSSAFAQDNNNLVVGLADGDQVQAVSSQEMNQTAIQVQVNPNLLNIAGQDMTFGDNTFDNQVLNNNNFTASSNAQQGGQIGITVAVD